MSAFPARHLLPVVEPLACHWGPSEEQKGLAEQTLGMIETIPWPVVELSVSKPVLLLLLSPSILNGGDGSCKWTDGGQVTEVGIAADPTQTNGKRWLHGVQPQ